MNAIHEVPAPCPKCGRGHLQGPRYRKGLLGREVLVYTCDVWPLRAGAGEGEGAGVVRCSRGQCVPARPVRPNIPVEAS